MRGSDPFDDFEDDGGTPAWRARHSRTIDVYRPGLRSWLRRTSIGMVFVSVAGLCLIILLTVFFGGLFLSWLVLP